MPTSITASPIYLFLSLFVRFLYFVFLRKLRTSQTSQILLCLCGTLLCLYITFIVMITVDKQQGEDEIPPIPCGIIAGFLHFSILSSISWMGVEGVNMFLKLITILNSYVPHFMLKAAIFAWGKQKKFEIKSQFTCVQI